MSNAESNNIISLNKNNLIQYFDFDKINNDISIRNRNDGDKIIPLGMSGNKKVKDIFIDMKIPKGRKR